MKRIKNRDPSQRGGKIMKVLGVIIAIYTALCIGVLLFLDAPDSPAAAIAVNVITLLWVVIPIIWIIYGIYQIATTKPTIPKVKERMPWDKGNPRSVDDEWRKELKEREKGNGKQIQEDKR